MKNKYIVLGSILIIVLSFLLVPVKDSFSITEVSGSLTLSCNSSSIIVGNNATCTLKGTISNDSVSSLSSYISVSDNLELVSVSKLGGWQGDDNTPSIQYYINASNNKSGTFDILSFVVRGKAEGSGSVSINNTKFYLSDYSEVNVDGRSFSISVGRQKSTDNTLQSLKVNGVNCNTGNTTCNMTINQASTRIEAVAPALGSVTDTSGGTWSNTKERSLNYGVNTFTLISRSESGSTKTYTIRITRESPKNNGSSSQNSSSKSSTTPSKTNSNTSKKTSSSNNTSNNTSNSFTSNDAKSSNNNLKSLTLSKGALFFDKDKDNYEVDVPYKVSSIKIEGEAESDKAKIEGLGKKTLSVGENKIEIKVIAENGDVKTYTIKITRRKEEESKNLDTNNYLKDLSIVGYEFDFDKDTLDYEIKRNGNSRLKIKAITESDKAEVAIVGNENLKDKDEIKIVVTAEDGDNRIYTITVVDGSDVLFTAVGIFLIGVLSLAVVIAYRKKKSLDDII